ncbi:MAG: hypothetical protein MZU91_01750 [Desulfosudis oleivorans]|nr:hypothetical protein [Desulfosudis oleivorans]
MKLENRAVMPAMGTAYANMDNTPSDRLVQYLASTGKRGHRPHHYRGDRRNPPRQGIPQRARASGATISSALFPKIPQAIHREGGKAAIQLHHAGRETFQEAAGGHARGAICHPQRHPGPALRGDEHRAHPRGD